MFISKLLRLLIIYLLSLHDKFNFSSLLNGADIWDWVLNLSDLMPDTRIFPRNFLEEENWECEFHFLVSVTNIMFSIIFLTHIHEWP